MVTVLWLVSYIFADVDVLVLRRCLPKAPLTFVVLGALSYVWIKRKMHMPALRPVNIAQVLAMENDLYYQIRHRRGIWR